MFAGYPSFYLPIYLSVCLSINLSVCLSVCLSIYLSIYLSICLSNFLLYLSSMKMMILSSQANRSSEIMIKVRVRESKGRDLKTTKASLLTIHTECVRVEHKFSLY